MSPQHRVQLLYAGMKFAVTGCSHYLYSSTLFLALWHQDTVEMFSRGLSLYVEGYKNRIFTVYERCLYKFLVQES
jgi:hypothetical protein